MKAGRGRKEKWGGHYYILEKRAKKEPHDGLPDFMIAYFNSCAGATGEELSRLEATGEVDQTSYKAEFSECGGERSRFLFIAVGIGIQLHREMHTFVPRRLLILVHIDVRVIILRSQIIWCRVSLRHWSWSWHR
jgi:hypothetical protein